MNFLFLAPSRTNLKRLVLLGLSASFSALAAPAQTPANSSGQTAAPTLGPTKRPVRTVAVHTPGEMKWENTGSSFPNGSKLAILMGNPGRPIAYAVRVKIPEAVSDGPHWHGTDVQVTVIQGTMLFAVGDMFDESKLARYGPGSFLLIPAGLRHFIAFQGEAEYQIQGTGPLRTYAVRPAAPPPTLAKATPSGPDPAKFKSEFDAAVAAFQKAAQARDRNALNSTVRADFEKIARGGGPYASAAQEYLSTRIPAEVAGPVPAGACPAIARSNDVGWVVQEFKAGDVVASAFLEQKLEWTACPSPDFPAQQRGRTGVVRLTVFLNENGSVIGVKPRGGVYPPGVLESAATAVRGWRTNPPRARGVPVKTEISIDLPYGQ